MEKTKVITLDPTRLTTQIKALKEERDYDRLFYLSDARCTGLVGAFLSDELISLPTGEACKSIETAVDLWQMLLAQRASRQSCLVAIGGGATSDLVGWVAANYMRGISYLNIPTTLLACVDASIGGKCAINLSGVKNVLGSFHAPDAVLIAPEFLKSLPSTDLLSGFGEVLKYALLIGGDFFYQVITSQPDLVTSPRWSEIITKCLCYKQHIVSQDPFDKGLRRVLNLGHTFGHAFEALSQKGDSPLPHGHAVASGLIYACLLSYTRGLLSRTIFYQVRQCILELGLYHHVSCNQYDALWELVLLDKKNTRKDTAGCILLKGLGEPLFISDLTRSEFEQTLDLYSNL